MTDLISRADAIEAVCSAIRKEWLLREAIVADIEALPSADVSRIEYDDRVELSVSSRQKDKVILKDAFGSMEYVPSADAKRETVTVYRGECTVHWDRPHGEWRKGEVKYDVDDDVLYETYYKCDQCGYVENLDYPPNYCANCGADMRKESDTE